MLVTSPIYILFLNVITTRMLNFVVYGKDEFAAIEVKNSSRILSLEELTGHFLYFF